MDELAAPTPLLRRFGDAEKRRLNWEDLWETAFQYAIPHKEVFSNRTRGRQQNVQVYDETAVEAVPKFATRVQSALVPPWTTWAKLVPGSSADPDQAVEPPPGYGFEATTLAELFEEMTDIMFAHIHQSNFSSQAFEAFQDLTIAPGALLAESDPVKVLNFTAVPISELYLECGPDGSYETVWRKHRVKGRHIKRKWPDASLSSDLAKQVESSPDAEHVIIEGTIYEPTTGDYHLKVIHKRQQTFLVERNLGGSSPWIVFPWSRTPGEIYSRGPVISILPAILTLNKAAEFILKGAAWKIMGLWTGVDDGVWNPYSVKLEPGTIIPVGSNATADPSIRPLDVGGDVNFADWFMQQKQRKVERALFANPIGDVQSTPVRTLGENMLRMQELLEESGASISLLESEFVARVLKRCLFVLQESGHLPALGDDGTAIEIDGELIQIKMQSPIAQARDAQELGALGQWAASAGGALGEGAMVWLNPGETAQYIQEQTGLPKRLIRTQQEVDQIMQQAAEVASEQAGGI